VPRPRTTPPVLSLQGPSRMPAQIPPASSIKSGFRQVPFDEADVPSRRVRRRSASRRVGRCRRVSNTVHASRGNCVCPAEPIRDRRREPWLLCERSERTAPHASARDDGRRPRERHREQSVVLNLRPDVARRH
jgi:hypothetical protein